LDEFRQFKKGTSLENLNEPGDLMAELVTLMPQFKGAEEAAPSADFRIAGQKIPREPHRYSGRTAMLANIQVSEPKPPEDTESPLSYTMEGYRGIPPAPLTPFFWSPGWNSVQSVNKYQEEVGGPIRGGDTGKRLFQEVSAIEKTFLDDIPPAYQALPGEWLVVPLQHIFGSEELSIYTHGVAERAPHPYIAISRQDAEDLNISESQPIGLTIAEQHYELPAIIKEELPNGLVGIPYHVSGLSGISWLAKGILKTIRT